jgi:uncharacterized protein (DUF433 family)
LQEIDVIEINLPFRMYIDRLTANAMTAITIDIGTLISRTPGLHGGVPHISSKGVTVRRIVTWYKRGLVAEEIGDHIGHITLAEVYAALAYYHANTAEIEADIAHQAAEAERLEALHQSARGSVA